MDKISFITHFDLKNRKTTKQIIAGIGTECKVKINNIEKNCIILDFFTIEKYEKIKVRLNDTGEEIDVFLDEIY